MKQRWYFLLWNAMITSPTCIVMIFQSRMLQNSCFWKQRKSTSRKMESYFPIVFWKNEFQTLKEISSKKNLLNFKDREAKDQYEWDWSSEKWIASLREFHEPIHANQRAQCQIVWFPKRHGCTICRLYSKKKIWIFWPQPITVGRFSVPVSTFRRRVECVCPEKNSFRHRISNRKRVKNIQKHSKLLCVWISRRNAYCFEYRVFLAFLFDQNGITIADFFIEQKQWKRIENFSLQYSFKWTSTKKRIESFRLKFCRILHDQNNIFLGKTLLNSLELNIENTSAFRLDEADRR